MAELWGAWVGLKLVWDLGHCRIDVRMDAQGLVKLLNKEVDARSVGWSICKRIWKLLELDWEVRIRHTYRESNLCAGLLAHEGCNGYHYDYMNLVRLKFIRLL
jgi:ribonuclease HI